jgi:HAD superfamily hydrolase (TIGR01509 family)
MKAVVFDMDGVLLDTERVMKKAWEAAALEIGFERYKEAGDLAMGRNRAGVRQLFAESFPEVDFEDFHSRYSEGTQKALKENGVPLKEGVIEALEIIKSKGYVIAVATSTYAEHALPQLREVGITDYASVIMTGDTVKNGKPHPEIYLKACEKIAVPPEEAYGAEDSSNGIRSAHAAGMRAVFLPDLATVPEEYKKDIDEEYATILDFAKSLERAD